MTPAEYADDVLGLVLSHLAGYVTPLSPAEADLVIPSLDQVRASTLWHEARDLARYAATGRDAEVSAPHEAHAYAWDRAREVTIALDASPSTRVGTSFGEGRRFSSHEPTDTIVQAVHARGILCGAVGEDSLDVGELAALADLTEVRVRALIASGEIRARARRDSGVPGTPAHRVSLGEARRWLSARGVEGISP